MNGMLLIAGLLLGTAVALVLAGRMGLFAGTMPGDLGAREGRLKAPSATRNSVSSQADHWRDSSTRRYAQIDPLRYDGNPSLAMPSLLSVVQHMPGGTVIEARPDYVYAQFTTRWLRFVDDVEFLLAPGEGVTHVRSASRLGREDFGANRRRIEAIRAAFEDR